MSDERSLSEEGRRVRRVEVTRSALAMVLKNGIYKVTSEVPKDAVVVGVDYDSQKDFYNIMLHSKEFDVVTEYSSVPKAGVNIDGIADVDMKSKKVRDAIESLAEEEKGGSQ